MSEVKCAHCGSTEFSVDLDDYDDGQGIECGECGETNRVWLGELVTADDYHEYRCDSIAARRFEEDAYGDDREYYIESRGRRDPDREDFHSDG